METRPTLTSVYLGRKTRPAESKQDRAWEHFAYKLTLSHEGRGMDFDYSAGLGHTKLVKCKPWGRNDDRNVIVRNAFGPGKDGEKVRVDPTLFDALYCLCLDAHSYDDSRNFEDWCGEFGYDSDRRTAESTYRTVGEQAKNLRRVLGSTLYGELCGMDEDALRAWCENTAALAPKAGGQ